MNILNFSILKKQFKPKNKSIQIGNIKINIPFDHKLDDYSKTYPRYDQALGEIARIIYEYLGSFTAIDIGANVGDSAALICKYHSIPILCIEGCNEFIPYLKLNATRINSDIKIIESFVGTQSILNSPNKELIKVKNGTASIASTMENAAAASTTRKSINMRPLKEILSENETFKTATLIKIDTDGCDFSIITQSLNCLKHLPILFFEYDTNYKHNNAKDAIRTINALWGIGYRHFLVYDNFGNLLIALNDKAYFEDLNAYLESNRKYKQIVYYFDICAISSDKKHIFEVIKNVI